MVMGRVKRPGYGCANEVGLPSVCTELDPNDSETPSSTRMKSASEIKMVSATLVMTIGTATKSQMRPVVRALRVALPLISGRFFWVSGSESQEFEKLRKKHLQLKSSFHTIRRPAHCRVCEEVYDA